MEITTDTTIIHELIQQELDERWKILILEAQSLPFTNKRVLSLNSIGFHLYKDFAHNVVTKLKK